TRSFATREVLRIASCLEIHLDAHPVRELDRRAHVKVGMPLPFVDRGHRVVGDIPDLAAHFRVPAFHFRKLAEAQNETTRHAGSDERRALEEVMLLPMALERAVNEEPPQ